MPAVAEINADHRLPCGIERRLEGQRDRVFIGDIKVDETWQGSMQTAQDAGQMLRLEVAGNGQLMCRRLQCVAMRTDVGGNVACQRIGHLLLMTVGLMADRGDLLELQSGQECQWQQRTGEKADDQIDAQAHGPHARQYPAGDTVQGHGLQAQQRRVFFSQPSGRFVRLYLYPLSIFSISFSITQLHLFWFRSVRLGGTVARHSRRKRDTGIVA